MIQQIINDQKDTMTGELRIGIIPTLAPYLLPPLFKQMREKYPQLQPDHQRNDHRRSDQRVKKQPPGLWYRGDTVEGFLY